MKAVIFTYPPDYVAAAIAARQLARTGAEPVLAIDRADPELEVEGVRIVRTDFPRVGNLNGARCVRGIIQELLAASGEGDEWVLKVDSDTMVFNLDWLDVVPGADVVGRRGPEREMFGFCYAVRTSALPRLLRASAHLSDPFCNEDRTMAALAGEHLATYAPGPDCPLAGYHWGSREPVEHWQAKGAVAFQPSPGKGPREIAAAMRKFLR